MRTLRRAHTHNSFSGKAFQWDKRILYNNINILLVADIERLAIPINEWQASQTER